MEEKRMPGSQPKKNYKRLLSITLILTLILCCSVSPIAPMLSIPSRPVSAQAQALSSLNSCSGNQSFEGTMFALTDRNSILNINPGMPGVINSVRFISGLSRGENVVGIDFRPATGQLYAATTANRIYIINPSNGIATLVGSAALSSALSGTNFGFDFNPVPDLIRLVSNADQDLRINPNNAVVAGVDGTLAYAAGDPNAGQDPSVVGSAYTNSFAGTATTTLYGIDSNRDTLVTQGSLNSAPVSPNTGQLFTVGSLGVDTTDLVGFDIAPATNAAFASLTTSGSRSSSLYKINLNTGVATLLGPIGGGRLIRDIAFAVRPENVYGVTASNRLIRFNPGTPGAINYSLPITGLGSGENVVGIDYRPARGTLFALTDASRIFTLNTRTGAATLVGGGQFAPNLNGASFGFDFNPVPDAIRVTSDGDQNLRISPNNGAVVANGVDGTLAYAAADPNAGQDPNIVGSAYTLPPLAGSVTTLYGIDSNLNVLVTQGSLNSAPISPNTGQLLTVGSLGMGVDPNAMLGFDISFETGAALASFNTDGGATTQLFRINLATGAAAPLGAIGGGEIVRAIAIEARLPEVLALTAGNLLVHFNAATPGLVSMIRVIRGLPRRERLIGIDFRPATGQLYALSASNRIYLIILSDPARATAVRLSILNPALNGGNFGFDFNPVPDLIRLTSDGDQNLRINPNSGVVVGTDGTLAFAAGDPNAGANPNIVASAYTNSFNGAISTTLYGIDAGLGALVTQGSVGSAPVSPNTGQLFTVGSLGVPTTGSVGFDIPAPNNVGFLSLTPQGASQSQFFTVNLATGAARLVGSIGVNDVITGITVGGVARSGAFDICLQDDRTGDSLQFDSCTGNFQFTKCGAGAFILTGRGDTQRLGNLVTLRADRLFALANVNQGSPRSGIAVLRSGRIFVVNDNDSTNNTCSCR
jgi:trimeric autotransporter adhesin